jgi:D-aminoacyl-tRNA deacylase
MKAVVQRVSSASVHVAGERTGSIARGLLVYLGIGRDDTVAEAAKLVEKILHLRIFADTGGKLMHSVTDISGSLLVVSQFTLYATTSKGRRPSFEDAAPPAIAEVLYNSFIDAARRSLPVQTGRFGADMQVTSINDGPFTILLQAEPNSNDAGGKATTKATRAEHE